MIFISYRKADTQAVVDNLARELKTRFGDGFVFKDDQDLRAGDLWPQRLQQEVLQCKVLLAVIGKDWLTIHDEFGRRRIDDEEDWVRLEICTALANHKRVIVLLVDSAPLLSKRGLPKDCLLQELPELQHLPLRLGRDFDPDLASLLKELAALFPSETQTPVTPALADRAVAHSQGKSMVKSYPASAMDATKALASYAVNLISEIENNLVLEIYDKRHYEDICLTPLIRSVERPEAGLQDVLHLLEIPRSVIVGEPGSGKTTALRMLAINLLRRRPLKLVPIYLSLAAFDGGSIQSHRMSFADFINIELDGLGCESLDVLKLQTNIELVFLLDGWDEITEDEYRTEIKRYLNRTNAHFIITARPEVQRTLPAAEGYEIYPLSMERIREFVRLRLRDNKQAEDLYRWIASDAAVQSLASNPLNLSILGIVFSEEGRVDQVSRTKLYERAFDTILNQHHRMKRATHDGEDHDLLSHIDTILQRLAYRTLKSGNGRFFSIRDLHLCVSEELGSVPANITDLLAGRLGVIRDRRSGRFEFFHLWYQEFLAAKYIQQAGLDVVKEFDDPRISPALPFAVGLLGKSSQVERLMLSAPIHDIFNFCRALPEGGFSSTVMMTLLERVIEFGEHSDPPIPVRLELAKAMAQAGISAVRSLFDICRSNTYSDYSRRASLETLSQVANGDEFDKLIVELIQTTSKGLLWHVIEHAGNRHLKAAGPLLELYAEDSDPITAGDSLWAMRQINWPCSIVREVVVDGLLACLTADDNHVKGHALRTLGRLKVESALPAFHEYISKASSPYRWIVPEAAAMIGGMQSLAVLEAGLNDNDPRVRAASLKAIGEISDPVPKVLVDSVEQNVDDPTWIPFFAQSLGGIARSTLIRLKQKQHEAVLPTIYLARHCKTQWNSEGRLQGTMDIELSEEGVREAEQNLTFLNGLGIDRILCSTAKRAMQTAEIYANGLAVPLQGSPRLRELDHGQWEGQLIEDLLRIPNSIYKSWMADPVVMSIPGSTETTLTAQQRILEFVREVALTYGGETILLVSHKHILAILNCALAQLPISAFQQQIVESTLPQLINDKSVREIRSALDTRQARDHG